MVVGGQDLPITAVSASKVQNAAWKAEEIERLMRVLKGSPRPLQAWAIDLATRAYGAYQAYKNGKEIERIREATFEIVKDVADLKVRIDRGEELNDAEYRGVRERLDTYAAAQSDLEGRLKLSEDATKVIEQRVFRRACPVRHAWRQGKCVDVAAEPRQE